jgi:hypothetical protein
MSLADSVEDDFEANSSMFEASELSSVTADFYFLTAEVFFLGPIVK